MDAPPDIPNPPAHDDREQWRRLHPSSLFFGIGRLARTLLVPGLIVVAVLFFGGGVDDTTDLWFMILFVPSMIMTLLHYLTLRYRFLGDELVIRRGLIFRRERHIPFRKIQNIDLVQGVLHRVFNVAKVKIDTASGAEAEAELNVLDIAAVEEVRRRVFASPAASLDATPEADAGEADAAPRPQADAPQREAVTVLRLGTADLVRLGLISWRGLVLVAVVVAAAWQLAWQFDVLEKMFEERVGSIVQAFFSSGIGWRQVAAFVGFIILLSVLSIAWSILRFHGFVLERSGEDLRIRCGLFTRISATVPRRRIQFISVRETLLHRLFRVLSVRVETAGGKKDDHAHDALGERWIVPLIARHDLPRILNELRPGLSFEEIEWTHLAPRATGRMVRKAIVWGALLGAIGLVFWRPWGALAIIPIVTLFVYLDFRDSKYIACALTDTGVFYRSGVWTRKMSAAPYEKLQTIGFATNPFDRRYGHATLFADTAGAGPAGHRIQIPYLAEEFVRDAVGTLYRRTEESTFRWS